GSGARRQPLMVAATTAGSDPQSFAAGMHAEMQKIADEPERSPHTFVYLRNTEVDADPWDEANWKFANPALGDFLSLEKFRQAASDARNDPQKENAFRQFRLNQWVRQTTRWMPMHLYKACAGELWLKPDWAREQLVGREAWGGLDLSAKFDLTAWCVLLPPEEPGGPVDVLWRFWLPEDALPKLDAENDGKFGRWARQGWITVTEGNIQDYDRIVSDIAEDRAHFAFRGIDADEWSMWPLINRVAEAVGLDPESGGHGLQEHLRPDDARRERGHGAGHVRAVRHARESRRGILLRLRGDARRAVQPGPGAAGQAAAGQGSPAHRRGADGADGCGGLELARRGRRLRVGLRAARCDRRLTPGGWWRRAVVAAAA